MAVEDIYSKRQKRIRGETPDVYTYDDIPDGLRAQITHIWEDILGDLTAWSNDRIVTQTYAQITKSLRREYGVLKLPNCEHVGEGAEYFELRHFVLAVADHEEVLDAIELSFRDRSASLPPAFRQLAELSRIGKLPRAIEELNARFQEHGVGYQLTDGKIIRMDSGVLHADVVLPALSLLRDPRYAGAQEEFLRAHEHYRHGRTKEALNECLKSLESVLKTICDKRKWTYAKTATAQPLIDAVFKQGLVEGFWLQHFSSLRACLESGVPPARNKLGGHGQGTAVVDVPEYLVSFVLHQTAAAVVFLVEAEKALP